ncbi:PD-(D/E)XK motif protein [Thiolapillus brandeum]|uniref:PD-(D/E)XK motif protein n=1 Tax=Thiolapillus brandeum TaxID=1076588 RepID=A0A7U6GK08_9GAMM|nr:PD-(D/E)XK motif protein [Thiolapillus brandeum]BAO44982.1 conserved hypothetical protein [Thiolapillus brandeum]
MMTEGADPWKPLPPPGKPTTLSSRLVDPEIAWRLYWALDTDQNCLLVLRHDPANRPANRLPKLRGLEIKLQVQDADNSAILMLRLIDKEQREIFLRLCEDIIEATRIAGTEKEASERFLARTWRWHRLLRSGRDGRLSDEEQRGLIGELHTLRHILMPSVRMQTAIRSWTGPLNAPKDFEIGKVCIESKTRRGAATPFVNISNEFQLDTKGINTLVLRVLEVTSAVTDDENAITVTSMAREVFNEVQKRDSSVIEIFEERLLAAGFNWADDYRDQKWLLGTEYLYIVGDKFPKITPDMYPVGISRVRYSLSLQECLQYRTDKEKVKQLLGGGVNGN